MDNSKMPSYPLMEQYGPVVQDGKACIGLTKLEAFTMAAMQAYMSSQTAMMANGRTMDGEEMKYMASYCVKIARATLTELSKHQ